MYEDRRKLTNSNSWVGQGLHIKRTSELVIVILGLLLRTELFGADWPQFRNDAGRTAASAEELPQQLHLQWIRELGAPRPAFPLEVRLLFDASYEPVVTGKTMFVPSMVNDSITALDTESGVERWRFYAEGPVRFAPVVWQGKVYFVADDGYLYCLNVADGRRDYKSQLYPGGFTRFQIDPMNQKDLGPFREPVLVAHGEVNAYEGGSY